MPREIVPEGWYKIVKVYASRPERAVPLNVNKIFLERAERPVVYDAAGIRWIGIPYPSSLRGGVIYARLRKIPPQEPPCYCKRLRFPHKRNANCVGDD